MRKIAIFTLSILMLPQIASAEPSVLPLSMQHKGSVEASTGIGTGNIDREHYKLTGKLVSTKDKFTNELGGDFAGDKKKKGKTSHSYNVSEKMKYAIGDSSYTFGQIDFEKKKIAGIKARTSETVGFGHELINKDNFKLTGEVAGGYRQSDYMPGLRDERSMLGKVGTNMDWEVIDNVNLNNNTYLAYTKDNTQTVSDTSLKTYVLDNAYVKGGVEVENNSKAATGFKKTDAVTSVGLGYEF